MNKIYQKSFSGDKNAGFTLIELLVVVLIIGILSAVALPQYTLAVEKAHMTEAQTLLRSLMTAEKVYYMANGRYAEQFDDLDVSVPGATGRRFNTKHFTFFTHTAGTAANFHIDCQRLDGAYEIDGWLSKDAKYDKIMCNPKSDFGTKLCKSMGAIDPDVSSQYYVMY